MNTKKYLEQLAKQNGLEYKEWEDLFNKRICAAFKIFSFQIGDSRDNIGWEMCEPITNDSPSEFDYISLREKLLSYIVSTSVNLFVINKFKPTN